MIIIGEKINGAIPSVREAILQRDTQLIKERTIAQAEAGADFLDCAPSTETEKEYEAMCWLIDVMQSVTEADIENGETYLSVMEDNLKVLKEALQ